MAIGQRVTATSKEDKAYKADSSDRTMLEGRLPAKSSTKHLSDTHLLRGNMDDQAYIEVARPIVHSSASLFLLTHVTTARSSLSDGD